MFESKDYRNVEFLECDMLGKDLSECYLGYTPDSYPYMELPMNTEPLRPNIIRIGSDVSGCTMYGQKIKCEYEDTTDCKYHQPLGKEHSIFLECRDGVLEK